MTNAAQQYSAIAVETDALNGPGKAWGVEDPRGGGIYEAMFCEATARRLAELHTQTGAEWETQREILEREGFDIGDPADAHRVNMPRLTP